MMFEDYRKDRERRDIEFKVIRANRSHIEAIERITSNREKVDPVKMRKELETYFIDKSSRLYVALVEGEVVGFAKSKKYSGEGYSHEGWYLSGVIVEPKYRGAGIGKELTAIRMNDLQQITNHVYYFVNSRNTVSIRLHELFGFSKIAENFVFPGVKFHNGTGLLYRARASDL